MDHIPWVEKYRPKHFDDIILEKQNKIILQNMLQINIIPQLLFYGPPGTGKTTTIINFINNFQKQNKEEFQELIIHLNASDDRGIDTIRNQIHSFTTSNYLFNKGTKFIILDEVDYMTKSAQQALYNLIKTNTENVRFCLICNYISKLEKSLQNICMSFKFNTLPREKINEFLHEIVNKEKLHKKVNSRYIDSIINTYNSDIRSMINHIQSVGQNYSSQYKILTGEDIKVLIEYFIENTETDSDHKLTSYLKHYNIEKHTLIMKIINYMIKHYDANDTMIDFTRFIVRNKDYYLPHFNKFFISNVVSLLSV
jgi:replication factor C subunit 3/5